MPTSLSPLESIFFTARQIAAPGERSAYLDRACGDDPDVRRSIERMLAAEPAVGSFLEAPAAAALLQTEILAAAAPLGAQIGPYKLRELLGEGGFGLVYVAEQEQPIRRKVALKVIKPGMDTREVIARFEAERQALALMDHPNIAKVIDAGTAETGRPYFVMELVRGLPITDYCDQAKLPLRDRLKLFITVCQAIQHAHQKGIIHRDLKPSNVLITLHDGVAVPKVIDFGVAKALNQRLTEHTLYTRHAQMLGTPMYMSPEQAELSGLDVDTRSDVYSLGVLLYELLTGQTPFDKDTLNKAGFDELRRMIREIEPSRPSQRISTLGQQHLSTVASRRGIDDRHFARTLRGELDWIVMKALEKDRTRRYESVAELSTDVRRFLADEPVDACPPSLVYRLAKIVRRHAVALTTAAIVLATMVLATGVSAWMAIDARNARQISEDRLQTQKQALERERAAKQRIYPIDILGAFELLRGGKPGLARDLLSLHLPEPRAPDRRGFEWHYLWGLCHSRGERLVGHSAPVYMLEFSPDGGLLASASGDDTARLWDVRTGRLHRELIGHADDVNCVTFSPDGSVVVTASDDHTIGLWNPHTGKQLATLSGHANVVLGAVYRADGSAILSASLDGVVKVWDAATRTELESMQAHEEHLTGFAVSDDGTRIATCAQQTIKVWDQTSLEHLQTFENRDGQLHFLQWLQFRPRTRILFAGWRSGHVRGFDTDTGAQIGEHHFPLYLHAFRFNGDRQIMIPVAGGPGPLLLRNIDDFLPSAAYSVGQFPSHWAVAVSPDGSHLATATEDYSVHLIRDSHRPNYQWVAALEAGVDCIAVTPNGQSVLIGCTDETLREIDLTSGEELRREMPHQGGVNCIRFSPNGTLLATGGRDRSMQIHDGSTLHTLCTITGFADSVHDIAFSPDGGRLAACDGSRVKTWETTAWQPSEDWSAPSAVRIGIGANGGVLMAGHSWWYAKPGRPELARIHEVKLDGNAIAVSHSGTFSALGTIGLSPELFDFTKADVADDRVTPLSPHRSNQILAVAITHDEKTLAATDSRGWTAFWNIATRTKMHTVSLAELTGLVEHFERVSLAFTPDDSMLVFGLTPERNDNTSRHKGVVFTMHAPQVD